MAKRAELLAFGQFKKSIVGCLDYPVDYYDHMKEDKVVITTVFYCVTNQASIELANAFGIKVWDFNTHYISNKRIICDDVVNKIIEALESGYSDADLETACIRFKELIDAGLHFIYRPNG